MSEMTEMERRRAAYRQTAEALETIRTRELAAMTDAEALRIIKSLVAADTDETQPVGWSGLIE